MPIGMLHTRIGKVDDTAGEASFANVAVISFSASPIQIS